MKWFSLTILALIIIELGLYLLVRCQRRAFPWLITEQDEIPTLDSCALQKFINYSFDHHLGWVRKPNSSGIEHGQNGEITFQIDSAGARSSKFAISPPLMAAFGDSYVFCRQVEDDETWEAQLSKQNGVGTLNFGVGNYGVDQALLRYECTELPEAVRVVILGFVPETICRIQSYWKHYLEFGNTFAFKPRFVLDVEDSLLLLENPMQNAEDFARLREKLPKIREADRFYKGKFRNLQFRVPYLLSLLRNPVKQIKLICAIAFRWGGRALGYSAPWSENLPFTLVMKENLRDAHKLYSDNESTALLRAILLKFRELARSRGHVPLVLVMPQLLDIKLTKNMKVPYQDFFQQMGEAMPVIDLTDDFSSVEYENLYINDQYGGHLSPSGNRLVANKIFAWLISSNLNP